MSIHTPPQPKPTPKEPEKKDPSLQEKTQKAVEDQKKRKGRTSTILTSGSGDLSSASVSKKTLLGQ